MTITVRTNNFDIDRPPLEFGVRWDPSKSDPVAALTRLGDAVSLSVDTSTSPYISDFSNYYPWKGIERCNLNINGDIVAVHGDPNFNENTATVASRLPYFFYKLVLDPNVATNIREYWLSPYPLKSYRIHPAFERWDYTGTAKRITDIFVGSYEATTTGRGSVAGVAPQVSYSRPSFRTALGAVGIGFSSIDGQTWNALQWLYLIEYAGLDIQSPSGSAARGGISRGITDGTAVEYTGWTSSVDVNQHGFHSVDLGNASGQVQYNVGLTVEETSIPGHPEEGICTDGTYYYGFGVTAIYKYDSDWNLIASNTSAGSQVGVGHIGDGDAYNGVLYAACCDTASGFPNARIGKWHASDLSFIGYTSIEAQFNGYRDPSGCCVDVTNNRLWVCSFWTGASISYYNLSTLAYIGSITPSPATSYLQGIAFYNNSLYVSYCNSSSDLTGGIKQMNLTGGSQSTVGITWTSGVEIEGLIANVNGIRVLGYVGDGSTSIIYVYGPLYAMSFHGIENLFGNTWTLLDGVNIDTDKSIWLATTAYYVDQAHGSFTSPYIFSGVYVPTSTAWLKFPSWYYIPNFGADWIFGSHSWDVNGSGGTHACDHYDAPGDWSVPRIPAVGNNFFGGEKAGIFAMWCGNGYTGNSPTMSTRLMQIPQDIDFWRY